MQYLLLIYENEKEFFDRPQAEQGAVLEEYFAYTEQIRASGHLGGGEALEPTTTARTVRVRDGKTIATDGPFAETREQLGGYYLVDADSVDEAIALAARIPSARWGSIEVRPVMRFDQGTPPA